MRHPTNALLLTIALSLPQAASAASKKKPKGVLTPTASPQTSLKGTNVEMDDEAREALVRARIEKGREETDALTVQEKTEIIVIERDQAMSAVDKRAAIKKIRKSYLDKRNAVRLRARMELRAKLLPPQTP